MVCDAMDHNDVTLLVSVISAIVPLVVSILTLFKMHTLHILVNSRLTELLRLNHAEGVQQGKDSNIASVKDSKK